VPTVDKNHTQYTRSKNTQIKSFNRLIRLWLTLYFVKHILF